MRGNWRARFAVLDRFCAGRTGPLREAGLRLFGPRCFLPLRRPPVGSSRAREVPPLARFGKFSPTNWRSRFSHEPPNSGIESLAPASRARRTERLAFCEVASPSLKLETRIFQSERAYIESFLVGFKAVNEASRLLKTALPRRGRNASSMELAFGFSLRPIVEGWFRLVRRKGIRDQASAVGSRAAAFPHRRFRKPDSGVWNLAFWERSSCSGNWSLPFQESGSGALLGERAARAGMEGDAPLENSCGAPSGGRLLEFTASEFQSRTPCVAQKLDFESRSAAQVPARAAELQFQYARILNSESNVLPAGSALGPAAASRFERGRAGILPRKFLPSAPGVSKKFPRVLKSAAAVERTVPCPAARAPL